MDNIICNPPAFKHRKLQTQACTGIPTDGLIASYLLTGTAEDETGTYDGTENGNTYAYDAERGVVASFVDSQYINVNTLHLTDIIGHPFNAQSYSFWVNFSTLTNYDEVFTIDKLAFFGYNTAVSSTSLYFALFESGTGISKYFKTTTSSLPTLNGWHHVILSYDGTDLTMYIDDVGYATSFSDLGGSTDDQSGLVFGKNSIYTMNAKFNNFHFYNRALTQTEVTQIYNVEKDVHNINIDYGLVAYYPLDGNSLDNAINQDDSTADTATYAYDATYGAVVADCTVGSITIPAVTGFVEMTYWTDTGSGWTFINTTTEVTSLTGGKYANVRKYNRTLSTEEKTAIEDIEKPSSTFCNTFDTVNDGFEPITYAGSSSIQTINADTITNGIDFTWIKNRDELYGHALFDSIRGIGKRLSSNTTAVEDTRADTLTAFGAGSFELGADSATYEVNNSLYSYVAWCASLPNGLELISNGTFDTDFTNWTPTNCSLSIVSQALKITNDSIADAKITQAITTEIGKSYRVVLDILEDPGAQSALNIGTSANGSEIDRVLYYSTGRLELIFTAISTTTYITPESVYTGTDTYIVIDNISVRELDTAGTIPSSVKSNSFMSAVTYTTPGSGTVGHGLNKKPDLWIAKVRNVVSSWNVSFDVLDGSWDRMYLDLNNSKTDNGFSADTTTFTAPWTDVGYEVTAYCFASTPGVCEINNFTVSGGKFHAYCGFNVAFFMCKRTDSTGDWVIVDNLRDSYLEANTTDTETTNGVNPVEFTDDGVINVSLPDGNYIFVAIAEKSNSTLIGA